MWFPGRLPFFEAITGLTTGASGRSVTYRGEVKPHDRALRFSVDFAGRTIDILLRRVALLDGSPVADANVVTV